MNLEKYKKIINVIYICLLAVAFWNLIYNSVTQSTNYEYTFYFLGAFNIVKSIELYITKNRWVDIVFNVVSGLFFIFLGIYFVDLLG